MEDQKSDFSKEFISEIENYRNKINSALSDELSKFRKSQFHNPLERALKGGKRIRPIILVLSYDYSGIEDNNPYPAAAAVEFAHMESLIHDDIIDQDEVRRKRESFHISNEKEMAILSADFILSIVLEIVSEYRDPRISRALSRAASRMCEGELEETKSYRRDENMDLERYLEILRKKTAVLFEVSAELGGILGKSEQKDIEKLSKYGRFVGMSYQIEDDLSDLEKEEKYNILDVLKTKHGLRKTLKEKARTYREKAKNQLAGLEPNIPVQTLRQLADYARPH